MRHALYRFYDADATLLYVGITGSLFRRISRHGKTAPWQGDVAHITVEWHPDRTSAAAAEHAAVLDERPRYNRNLRRPPRLAPATLPGLTGPVAVTAFTSASGVSLLVRCPYCGYRHSHGVGGGYGTRRSHCFTSHVGGSYVLTPATGPDSAMVGSRRRRLTRVELAKYRSQFARRHPEKPGDRSDGPVTRVTEGDRKTGHRINTVCHCRVTDNALRVTDG